MTRETSKTLAIVLYFQILNSDKITISLVNLKIITGKSAADIRRLSGLVTLAVGVEQHTPSVPPIFCSVALPTKSCPACLNNEMLLRAGVKCELIMSLLIFPLVKMFSS